VGFYDQFELLELVRDDGIKTFSARELATGRLVEVHVFVNRQAPLSMAVWSKLKRLEPPERDNILDRGDYEGTPYVVTGSLEGYPGLREWVKAAMHRVAPEPAAEPLSSAPDPEWSPAPAPVAPMNAAVPAHEPGEFTQMLQTPAAASAPPQPAPALSSGPPSPAQEPGEFTQMLRAPLQPSGVAAPSFAPTLESRAATAPPVSAPPSAPANSPSEFTRMMLRPPQPASDGTNLSMPVAAPEPPAAAPPDPPKSKPAFIPLAIPPQTTPDARVDPPSSVTRAIRTIQLRASQPPSETPSPSLVSPPRGPCPRARLPGRFRPPRCSSWRP
jgi:hypothetical protein